MKFGKWLNLDLKVDVGYELGIPDTIDLSGAVQRMKAIIDEGWARRFNRAIGEELLRLSSTP